MAKFQFIEWLVTWLNETSAYDFVWDSGNQTKSKNKHGIETFEIEEVFVSDLAIPLGIQISPEVDEERFGIVGPTESGKLLHIVFIIRGGQVRPISGRPAHIKERILYEKILR